jgi:fatty-acyl-CoA synthase
MFNALPAFHIAGLGLALISIARGGQTVCQPEFDPARVIAGVGEHRITHMFLVPAMILALIRTPGVERGDYRTLRSISYGASPISESVLVEALRVFGCGFVQLYGLTETCGAVTYLAPEDHDPGGARGHLLRAAGRAGPGVALRIVDAASGRDCAPGEVGEVWIRTRQNMKGYWRNPQATAQAYPEGRPDGVGWFRSGDAGYLRDGYLYIHDRIKDMIISGGENIYPAEVENALMQHPAIADGAVIGVPDERWGEAVKACVVLKPGTSTSAADIIDFVRERIAHYKCPKSVDFVKALPRNPSGKLLKYQLRQPYWQGQDRAVH